METFFVLLAVWLVMGQCINVPYRRHLGRKFKEYRLDLLFALNFLGHVEKSTGFAARLAQCHFALNHTVGPVSELLWSITRILLWPGDLAVMLLYHQFANEKQNAS